MIFKWRSIYDISLSVFTPHNIHIRSSICSIFSTVSSDIEFMLIFDSYSRHLSIISRSILSRIFFYFSHLMAP